MMLTRMRFLSHRARRRLTALACIAFLLAVSARLVKTEEPLVFAITNARIIPVSGAPIEKGTIVIRRGIIEAVGTGVTVPGDARVLDASGLTVYPGLIDAFSDIGLEEPAAARGAAPAAATPVPGRGTQQAQTQQASAVPPDERQGLTPYRRAFEEINPANRKIESARAAGITTTAVMPRRGFFPGQGSLLNLSGPEVGQMVVKPATSFFINTAGRGGGGGGGGGGGNYPGSLMGILAFIKQTLLEADQYAAAWNTYRANPGAERPEFSRALEALQPVLKREMPVILPANSPQEIQRALDLADGFKLNAMLVGCAEGGKMAAALKSRNIPVLVAVKYPERPTGTDPDFREEMESLRRRVEAPANAAALSKAGVRFALVSDDMANPRDFINNIGRAIEAGLDKDAALRALTLTPAEILGIADRLGSIEKNKTANLILATGDIFDQKTRVKHAFVDGRKFDITEPIPAPPGNTGRGGPGR
jgi:imidazolonepropionase-like amidohydrolase